MKDSDKIAIMLLVNNLGSKMDQENWVNAKGKDVEWRTRVIQKQTWFQKFLSFIGVK